MTDLKKIINVFERVGIYVNENDFDNQLEIDSIEFVSLVVTIEEEFDIIIPEEYLIFDKLNTVNQFVVLIDELTAK